MDALLIGFAQFARSNGLNVGVEETFSALRAFDLGVYRDKKVFYYGLKALFCSCKEDIPVFDKLYKIYWEAEEAPVQGKQTIQNPQNLPKQQNALAVWGQGQSDPERELDSKTVTGANAVARLRKTDFSKIAEMDAAMLEQLAERLWRDMLKRLKRRRKTKARKGKIDLRQTIRGSLEQGGDPVELRFKNKKTKKLRLVVLLDVSGSMDKYSFFLLRFIWALQTYFESVESYVFSTHLRRITELLKTGGLEKTLHLLSQQTDHWSGGTRIGDSLKTFNEHDAKRILARSACVIVLSDGLDTGETGLLEQEIQKMRRRAKRLIWLNPLKGMAGYQPTARGMSEALPHVDNFRSAHNLDSLLELERILINV
jgi:uncharacterized protein